MKHLVTILFLSMILISCQQNINTKTINIEEEKANVKKSIHNTIAWAKEKDTTLLYSIIADDKNYLEVHPSNRVVVGIDKFREAENFWLDERFRHVSFETWDMHITLSQDGKVAWYYCMLNDLNEWDGKSASWENTRWTGVLEKREGNWRMVQMHFSYPNK